MGDLPDTLTFSDTTKEKLKELSELVYKNDSTAVLDSIIVDSSASYMISMASTPSPSHNTYGEFYNMNMRDCGAQQYFNDYLYGNRIMRNATASGFNLHAGETIYITNCGVGAVLSAMKIIANFPSMTINGNNFYNIGESQITAALQTEQDFPHDTYLFYAPSVGLIKKEEDLGGGNIQSWSILRWHVVR